MGFGVLDRLAIEHLFRYEAARAASDDRALVFAVIELRRTGDQLATRCGTVIAGTLGPHDLIGHWGDGLVVIFHDADLAQARALLERAFARVHDLVGLWPAAVVRVVREHPISRTAIVAIAELA